VVGIGKKRHEVEEENRKGGAETGRGRRMGELGDGENAE